MPMELNGQLLFLPFHRPDTSSKPGTYTPISQSLLVPLVNVKACPFQKPCFAYFPY